MNAKSNLTKQIYMKSNADHKRLVENTVHTFIQDNNLLADGEKCLLAVSGGADSVCLLLLMLAYAKEKKTSLSVFHYNHHLRGADADRDEEFVRSLCGRYDLPFYAAGGDVRAFVAEKGMGLEEAARHLRYEALYKAADEAGADKIALAHHKNDQAETVLFHLCRGTGLAGLSGIKAKNGRLIRPLLCLQREEIEDYLACSGQEYMTDETNADEGYTRNLIRAKVLPLLSGQVNEQSISHICEAAMICGQAQDFISQMTEQAWEACIIREPEDGMFKSDNPVPGNETHRQGILAQKAGTVRLSIPALRSQPVFLQGEVMRLAISKTAGSKKDIGAVHVQELLSLTEKQSGKKVALPYGLEAQRSFDELLIKKKMAENRTENQAESNENSENRECDIFRKIRLPKTGESITETLTVKSGGKIQTIDISLQTEDFMPNSDAMQRIPREGAEKWIDFYQAGEDLEIRTARKGDFFYLDESHKKYVTDYYSDQKIPVWERDHKLILACGHHAVCIIGERISHTVRITTDTRRILKISLL